MSSYKLWLQLTSKKLSLELRGIDPRTSHMLSERSTTWATAPVIPSGARSGHIQTDCRDSRDLLFRHSVSRQDNQTLDDFSNQLLIFLRWRMKLSIILRLLSYVRMAEWSKAPDSRFIPFSCLMSEFSGPRMWAWVRIPLLTQFCPFIFADTLYCTVLYHLVMKQIRLMHRVVISVYTVHVW